MADQFHPEDGRGRDVRRPSNPPRSSSAQRNVNRSRSTAGSGQKQKRPLTERERQILRKRRRKKQQQRRMMIGAAVVIVLLIILLVSIIVTSIKKSNKDKQSQTSAASVSQSMDGADTSAAGSDSLSSDSGAGVDAEGSSGSENDSDGNSSGAGSESGSTGTGNSGDASDAGSGDTAGTGGDSSTEDASVSSEPRQVTISVVGDCTLGTDIYFDYSTSLNAYYDMYGPSYFLENVKDIFTADDLTIANFEGTITEADTRRTDRQFCFKAPPSYTSILTEGGVEAVTYANNHSHDYQEQGFSDTIKYLGEGGLIHFGYDETAVYEADNGVKIGLVGIYVLIDFMGVAPQLEANIKKVRDEGADVVVAIFHWGDELDLEPDYYQYTLARMAIDLGADLVCGHHAHVIQGIEVYKGKNICYGLANFCFGGNMYPTDMDTIIFQQTFTVTGHEVAMDNVTNIIPCSVSSDLYYNNYQPTPLTGDAAQRVMDKLAERTSMLQLP